MDVVVWVFDDTGWDTALLERLTAAGAAVHPVDPCRQDPLDGPGDAHVLAGGSVAVGSTRGSQQAWWHARRLVAVSDRTGLPVLGVGLGAQMLASVLMGTVASTPSPSGLEVGVVPVVAADGRTWRTATFHRHEITPMLARVPGVDVVASNRHTRVQAFTRRAVTGVQFHPEMSAGQLARVVAANAGSVEQATTMAAAVAAGPRPDPGTLQRWLLAPLGLPVGGPRRGPAAA